MTPSTEHPQALPDLPALRRLTKALAMLDAILQPEWLFRYYSHDSRWGPGEEMASMRNGSGDDWFLLFSSAGAALKGFAHEMPLARDRSFPARIRAAVPATFASFLREPAFQHEEATFCLWRGRVDAGWNVVVPSGGQVSGEADGSADLLRLLDGRPETYQAWAQGYHERAVPLATVRALYAHRPLAADLLASLNPELGPEDIQADAAEIGYPDPAVT